MTETPTVISLHKERFIRFAIWVIAMLAASLSTLQFAPHKVFLVPCVALVFFAPAVLMPLRRNQGGKSDA
jgi:hypothetical protein